MNASTKSPTRLWLASRNNVSTFGISTEYHKSFDTQMLEAACAQAVKLHGELNNHFMLDESVWIEEWDGAPGKSKKIREIKGEEIIAAAKQFDGKATTLITHIATAWQQSMTTRKLEPHHITGQVDFAIRSLEIERDMGYGLPDEQRACYKAKDLGSIKALELCGGNLPLAHALLGYARGNVG